MQELSQHGHKRFTGGQVTRTAGAMTAHGHFQRQESVIHLCVTKLEDLSRLLTEMTSQSPDFR